MPDPGMICNSFCEKPIFGSVVSVNVSFKELEKSATQLFCRAHPGCCCHGPSCGCVVRGDGFIPGTEQCDLGAGEASHAILSEEVVFVVSTPARTGEKILAVLRRWALLGEDDFHEFIDRANLWRRDNPLRDCSDRSSRQLGAF